MDLRRIRNLINVPTPEELGICLTKIGFGKIRFVNDSTIILPKGLMLDFGGIAKGYIMKQVQHFLQRKRLHIVFNQYRR